MRAGAIASPSPLVLPRELEGQELVVSVSGGKDSNAVILALREAEIPARFVFADTGWEAAETYEGPLGMAPPVRTAVTWARTGRGVGQLPLFEAGPQGGCLRWALCQPLPDDSTEESARPRTIRRRSPRSPARGPGRDKKRRNPGGTHVALRDNACLASGRRG